MQSSGQGQSERVWRELGGSRLSLGTGGEDMLFIFVGGWLRRLIQASQYIPTCVHIHLYDHSSGDKEIERWGQRREIHFMRGEMITDWIRD